MRNIRQTDRTYQGLGDHVIDVPTEHNTGDLSAAIALAMKVDTPTFGLFYRTTQPTLAGALDAVVEKASSKGASGRNRAA